MFTRPAKSFLARKPRRARALAVAGWLVCLTGNAGATVIEASPQGFVLVVEARIAAPPPQVYAALVADVGQWWNPAHTFSGKAGNLSIDARAGGCFCEKLVSGGSVQHMAIVFAAPGKMLRMAGGLGPLQELAVAGSLTWQLHEDPPGTRLELRYNVGGYLPDGLEAWAAPVDSVLGEQLSRLRNFVEKGDPEIVAAPGDTVD